MQIHLNNNNENLKIKIELLRICMISTGMQLGLDHPKTLKYSQELDVVLNDYHRIKPKQYFIFFSIYNKSYTEQFRSY
jgi:hypothetical protein